MSKKKKGGKKKAAAGDDDRQPVEEFRSDYKKAKKQLELKKQQHKQVDELFNEDNMEDPDEMTDVRDPFLS